MTETPSNVPEFTVSSLSAALKRTVEDSYGHVRVKGEISRPSFPGSGHCYLRLKDDDAVLDGVIWRGTLGRLQVRPEEGLEVIATGRLTTFAGKSSYQIVIDRLEIAGVGALLKLLEERRRKLAAEGLFDADRKRPIPLLPQVIGVVTSSTGAVIHDILHRLADRFPRHVLLWPVRVQGEGAAEEVAAAIRGFNTLAPDGPIPRPDVLIVARGGGSLEDLWAFNEEVVVRAAADSAIPLISAVGHETDTTLIDFAADHRAPTPTAAAERAVPVRLDLLARLRDLDSSMSACINRVIADRRTRLEGLARGIPDLVRLLAEAIQRLDDRTERLRVAIARLADGLRGRLDGLTPRPALLTRDLARHHDELARLMSRLGQSGARDLADRRRTLQRAEERLAPLAARRLTDARSRLEGLAERLEANSHQAVLARGYALVWDDAGRLVRDGAHGPETTWTIEFAGGIRVDAAPGSEPASPRRPASRTAAPKPAEPKQGRLL